MRVMPRVKEPTKGDTMSEAVKAWVELDETVATAEAIGFSREEAERIIGRMRRETSWDMTRIRKEIVLLSRGTQ